MKSIMTRSLDDKNNLGGRTGIHDAQQQLRGYLNWALDIWTPWEILVEALRIERKELRTKKASSIEKRLEFLDKLRLYHAKKLHIVNKEIKRTKEVLSGEGGEAKW